MGCGVCPGASHTILLRMVHTLRGVTLPGLQAPVIMTPKNMKEGL